MDSTGFNKFWQLLEQTSSAGGMFTPQTILLSLLLAFVLGQVIAWVYYFTHTGLSYSRSYVQSLILMTVVVAMVMAVIGNNIVSAVGLMGALALIRFRNVIKDTRDVVFIFCALVVGMACGSQRHLTAIMGTIVLCLIVTYLHLTNFGMHEPQNAFLRFNLNGHIGKDHLVPAILRRFCGNFVLISAHDSNFKASMVEYAYQLMVKSADKNEQMLEELKGVEGLENISLTMQEQLLEV